MVVEAENLTLCLASQVVLYLGTFCSFPGLVVRHNQSVGLTCVPVFTRVQCHFDDIRNIHRVQITL